MKEGSASLLRLFLLVLGCLSMAVAVHETKGSTNTNFYSGDHYDEDEDDGADYINDQILTQEMALFHSWRREFSVEYKTAKELEERMEVWLQNHGMSCCFCCCCRRVCNSSTLGTAWID